MDLTSAFYEITFRLRYVESNGDSFQNFFSTLMELRYPGDFVRVTPWGKLGDRKNDGYLRSQRRLFQCYAPREMELKTCLGKINEDFLGALPHWREHFGEWIFTHNDRSGLPADVLSLLLQLSETHRPLKATHWGYTELLNEFKRLPRSDVMSLLGPGLGLNDVVSVGVAEVRQLLEHIALQPEPLILEVKPVPAEKLKFNQLSSAAETLLRVGMTRANVVRKYLRGLSDQTRHDRLAAAFRMRYEELKTEGHPPDDIFAGLQKFVGGDSVPSPSHQAATLAILAFLFEECEIFERPTDEQGKG